METTSEWWGEAGAPQWWVGSGDPGPHQAEFHEDQGLAYVETESGETQGGQGGAGCGIPDPGPADWPYEHLESVFRPVAAESGQGNHSNRPAEDNLELWCYQRTRGGPGGAGRGVPRPHQQHMSGSPLPWGGTGRGVPGPPPQMFRQAPFGSREGQGVVSLAPKPFWLTLYGDP